MSVSNSHVEVQLEAVVDGLVARTGGAVRRHELRAMVLAAYEELAADAKVTTFLPVLAGRLALRQVTQQGLADPSVLEEMPTIVVVGQSNAGRSQSAAALLRFYAPGRFEVESAGIEPAGTVEPMLVEMMGEVGAELTDPPQGVTSELIAAATHVVAIGDPAPEIGVGSADAHVWVVSEPPMDSATAVLEMLRQIESHVRSFLVSVDPGHELHDSLFGDE